MGRSQSWKYAEKALAETLRKHGIPAYRVTRGSDFGVSNVDVEIENFDLIRCDSKYSAAKPFRTHGLIKIIKAKYCKRPDQVPVLYTRNFKEQGGMITIEEDFFAELLRCYMIQKGVLKNE